jgi:hypothetical protein
LEIAPLNLSSGVLLHIVAVKRLENVWKT